MPDLTLEQFIAREISQAKLARAPNAISLRFVQLHEQTRRDSAEQQEYAVLLGLMRARWRWTLESK
jgi:hypothetical protein